MYMAMDQREANLFFQMVNHYYERSIGLGGGTVVRLDEDGEFTIGPDSVGHRLYEKGLLFGGDTLTTTDVVVALGKANLGHVEQLKHLDKVLLQRVYDKMVEMVEETIDKMKTSAEPVPVILVGGGSILLPTELKGASELVKSSRCPFILFPI